MLKSNELKDTALATLKGNWQGACIAVVVFLVITLLMQMVLESIHEGLSGIGSLLLMPLGWGLEVYFLRMARGESVKMEMLFDGMTKQWVRIFLAYLLQSVYIFLWMLLLIVPGIIKSYSYAMMPYILLDHPEMSGEEAIKKSMEMMDGHKMRLFLLHLSFIGWILLSILSFGLGFIALVPYMNTAQAHFYRELKGELQMPAKEATTW